MANYTTKANIESYLGRLLTTNENNFLVVLLPAIDKWIDRMLETTFADVSPTTRYYDGGYASIDIDPCTAITAIEHRDIYGSVIYTYQTQDYILEPANQTVKTELRLRFLRNNELADTDWSPGAKFPRGIENLAITAKFSEYDGAVPEDVVLAATRLAAIMLRSSGNLDGVESETIEGHQVAYNVRYIDKLGTSDPIVQGFLTSRKRLQVI